MSMYIGLDVHSKDTKCVVKDESGKELGRTIIATTEEGFRELLTKYVVPAGTQIGLETGCQARWVSQVLTRLGMKPIVIEAGEVHAKRSRKRQKNDFRDAEHICDGLIRKLWESIVWMPPAEIEELRYLLLRRDHFVRLCTREISSAKGLMRSRGISTKGVNLTTEAGWKKLVARDDIANLRDDLRMLFETWKLASKHVEKLDRKLRKAQKPVVKVMELLQTLFSVGPISALAFIAWIGDPRRFPNSNSLISYLGLAPSTYDSGEKQCRGHITKQGPRLLRSILVELAHQSRRVRHPLNPYYRQLAFKRGKKCALVAIAARLARILWQMWRKNEPFDLTKVNVTARIVTKIKKYYYELKKPQPAAVCSSSNGR